MRRRFYSEVREKCKIGNLLEPQHVLLPDVKLTTMIFNVGSSAGYNWHQDHSYILNSPSNDNRKSYSDGAKTWYLPTREEMIVLTSAFATDDDKTAKATILHSYNHRDTTDTNSDSIIETRSNGKHNQSAGANKGSLYHKTIKPNLDGRMVITKRAVMDPMYNMPEYVEGIILDGLAPDRLKTHAMEKGGVKIYNEYNVIGFPRTPLKPPIVIHKWWNTDEEFKQELANRRQKSACNLPKIPMPIVPRQLTAEQFMRLNFKQLTVQGKSVRGIARTMRLLAINTREKNNTGDIARNHAIVNACLENGIILHLVDKHNRAEITQPLFLDKTGLPLCPGRKVHSDDLPVKSMVRKHEIISFLRMQVSLYEPYKNYVNEIDASIAFHIDFYKYCFAQDYAFDQSEMDQWKKKYEQLPSIKICCTGGSARKAGSVPFNESRSTPMDSHVATGIHQAFTTAEALAFQKVIEDEEVVTVCYHCQKWLAHPRENNIVQSDKIHKNIEQTEEDDMEDDVFLNHEERPSDNYGNCAMGLVGFYRAVELSNVKLEPHQVGAIFSNLPSYCKKEKDNSSHFVNGSFVVTLKPCMSFKAYVKICEAHKIKAHNIRTDNRLSDGFAHQYINIDKPPLSIDS
jgi:hypothetical protein